MPLWGILLSSFGKRTGSRRGRGCCVLGFFFYQCLFNEARPGGNITEQENSLGQGRRGDREKERDGESEGGSGEINLV